MNYLYLLITTCFAGLSLQAQTFDWAKKLGGSINDVGYTITTDADGNVYSCGYFQNTVDFDPSAGVFNLTAEGGYDIYISKLDASGNFVWAKKLGGTFNDVAVSITIDESNNIYTLGYFQSTADFDPGLGEFNLSSTGGYDIFISKLDAAGDFVWAKNMGGSNTDYGYAITTDPDGNVYSTGYFQGTADFDPGAATFDLISEGSRDIYVAKLDAAGDFVWAKSIGGSGFDNGNSISVDELGNVLITGGFQDTVDFDPGAGIVELYSKGLFDVFIAKLDGSGNFEWAKSIGGLETDLGTGLCTDAEGNVYTTGYFNGTVDFDPGLPIVNLVSGGSRDIFVSKLDPSGNFVWAKRQGGTGDNRGFAIAIDSLDNIYTTGMFENSADFDPGISAFNLTSIGNNDVFISKLNTAGAFLWAIQMGGSDDDEGNSITIDATGNIYTTGVFEDIADFDPSPETFNLTSEGGTDVFIHKISQCPSSVGIDVITACDSFTWIDDITYTESTDEATYTIIGGAASGCDSVVTLNLTINTSATNTDFITACDSYTWIDDSTYIESTTEPTFTILGGAANGCDSIVTLNLTINSTATGSDFITACDSYTWIDDNTYTESTTEPTFTILGGAANGCDSIVTLNLTINSTATGSDFITACDSYTWIDDNTYTESTTEPTFTILGGAANGCDSVVTLNLTINSTATGTDLITACDSYTWIDDNTYTESTTEPTFTILGGAANGCDSVVNLDLTILSVSDISTTTLGTVIIANNTLASYQWLDCNNSYAPIVAETNQNFIPTVNGSYAVALTESGCTDTSLCVEITSVGINEDLNDPLFSVYPNPTSGHVNIRLAQNYDELRIVIYDALGQKVSHHDYTSTNLINLHIEGKSGMYMIEFIAENEHVFLKVMKE
jgi:hypothetical protein